MGGATFRVNDVEDISSGDMADGKVPVVDVLAVCLVGTRKLVEGDDKLFDFFLFVGFDSWSRLQFCGKISIYFGPESKS